MKLIPEFGRVPCRQNICLLIGFAILANTSRGVAGPVQFRGSEALAYTKRAVDFGERFSGSKANSALRDWIISTIRGSGAKISFDSFSAETPDGPVPMVNIVAEFPGTSGRAVALSGHYDTKRIAGVHFLGADDGGSSTGFLLEAARVAASTPHRDDWYLVFFDGEEAVREWTATDSCYGSRHLAAQWLADGTLRRLKALINVDMIGDADLNLLDDQNSSEALRARVRQIAKKLDFGKYLAGTTAMDDDHRPFAELGSNVIDLIDFDYGPGNKYWHSGEDTIDKLSSRSLQVVGNITMELMKEVDGEGAR